MSYFKKKYSSIRYPIKEKGQEGLREAQLGALHSIAGHFSLRNDPAIIVMPTGSGKTAILMLSAFILRAKRVLVITPSRLVRSQIKEQFQSLSLLKKIHALEKKIAPPAVYEITSRITSLKDWEALKKIDVIVGTPNCISPAIAKIPNPPDDLFDLILIDEAHHSPAKTWNTVLDAFPSAKRVLFTATPFRRDKKEIKGKFVYLYPLRAAHQNKIFGQIEYIPVKSSDEAQNDLLIAKAAEKTFKEDQKSGYNHFLMVRTDSRKRANKLLEIYRDNTDLNLQIIHSGHSYQRIKQSIKKLTSHELDGIICVAMLGEGFDFPNLKIAAIHAPHKSLEVTLQFIGRFARTNAPDIGQAKFLAVPSDIEIETELLYHESAVWEDIIINLSESRIEKEVETRETLDRFETPSIVEFDIKDLSLYSLRPGYHVKIYQARDVNIENSIQFPFGHEIIYQRASKKLSTLIIITREAVKARWTTLDLFQKLEYNLFIIYNHKPAQLMFINASRKSHSLYETIMAQLSNDFYRQLPLAKVNKVLVDLEEMEFFNIGMKNRVLNNNTESYRIMSGPSAQKAVSRTDGKLYNQGHIFGKSNKNGRSTTIGYSSASKVWSNTSSQIPDFINWCNMLAEKVQSSKQVQTYSELDNLSVGEEITQIPEGIIAAEWDREVFVKDLTVSYQDSDGKPKKCPLIELEINIDLSHTNPDSTRVVITGEGLEWSVNFSLNTDSFFVASSDHAIVITFEKNNETMSLISYLNANPIHLYTADFSRLQGNELFRSNVTLQEPFDKNQILAQDWDTNNVDITNEFHAHTSGNISIHQYIEKLLVNQNFDIVFYDHGPGEIADFITLEEMENEIIITLYHIKASGGPRPGNRVNDVYEVTGQVVKSLLWLNNSILFQKISYREKYCKGSEFKKGDLAMLERIFSDAKYKSTKYNMSLVQPGISKEHLSEKNANVLAAAADYIKSSNCEKLIIIASE